MATTDSEKKRERGVEADARAKATAARAELVDVLAGGIFTLILKGEAPGLRAARPEQHGECS